MSTATEPQEVLVGGWSPFGPVSEKEMEIFTEVTGRDQNIGNAHYVPHAVSTQVIAGMNYR
ncbi:MAG: hypothetical protein ACFB10_24290 [Salibacteraceae bacterium]